MTFQPILEDLIDLLDKIIYQSPLTLGDLDLYLDNFLIWRLEVTDFTQNSKRIYFYFGDSKENLVLTLAECAVKLDMTQTPYQFSSKTFLKTYTLSQEDTHYFTFKVTNPICLTS